MGKLKVSGTLAGSVDTVTVALQRNYASQVRDHTARSCDFTIPGYGGQHEEDCDNTAAGGGDGGGGVYEYTDLSISLYRQR